MERNEDLDGSPLCYSDDVVKITNDRDQVGRQNDRDVDATVTQHVKFATGYVHWHCQWQC
jgi:hypothetical protein